MIIVIDHLIESVIVNLKLYILSLFLIQVHGCYEDARKFPEDKLQYSAPNLVSIDASSVGNKYAMEFAFVTG